MQAVKEFESRRDEIQSQRTHLDAAVQAGSVIFQKTSQEYQEETRRIELIRIDAAEHPEVVAILTLPEDQRLAAVEAALLQIHQSLSEVSASESQYRTAQKNTARYRNEEKQSSAAAAAARLRLSDVEKSHAVLQERRLSVDSMLTRYSADHKIRQTHLDELWQHLPGMVSLFETDPAEFHRTFESATGTCICLEKRMAELHTRFQELSATIAPLEESVRTARSAFDQCDTELVTLTKEQQLLLQDRSQLFDGRPVVIVEQEFANLVRAASEAVERAAAQRIDADKNLELAKADTEAKLRTRTDAEAALHAAEQTLHRWISDFCSRTSNPMTLSDLDRLLTRDEQWIRSERALLQQLAHAVTAAQTACEVHATKLEQHLARQHGTEDESAVMAALAELQVARQQAQDLADSARAVIQNDDDLQRKNTELASEIVLQQQKADPWLKLSDLIGSQDGAKFRMIAQRRTLDLLLRYANHQLNHLAARYRLERIPESLNLIVVDRDMSDEQRSIHSLSGGESFLVSLALALALASLTSNRLRIESLFIDEGFGSLDKETLNTAMSALMHLEAQGRKVGVISHVTEMTDAIPVQIQIVKGRGGTSRIVIPGAAASDSVPSVHVSAVSGSAPETTASPQSIAAEMLLILQRERDRGKTRVSCRALREELNCTAETFKAAQSLLQHSVEPDGRSLRLKS
jgi:exonuclease SbcC